MSDKASTVLIAGDFCARDLLETIDENYAQTVLTPMKHILDSAELRMINLENAVIQGGEPIAKSGPALKALPENLSFLTQGGFDCAILANNHVGDYGEEGVRETMRLLAQQNIAMAGAGANIEESYRPAFFELEAGRLALVAICENEFGMAEENKAGTAGYEPNRARRAIEAARDGADFVVVVMHSGNEYNPFPSPRVVERYHSFVDFGADAVIGMHPHRVQGFETYRGAPIAYSTGNFFFHAERFENPRDPWYYGYIARLTLKKGKAAAIEPIPYRFDPACTRITPLEDGEKKDFLAYLARLSEPISDPQAIARLFLGWCMIGGVSYVKALRFDESDLMQNPIKTGNPVLSARNLFCCEAHNELLTEYLKLIVDGKLDTALTMKDEILRWQPIP